MKCSNCGTEIADNAVFCPSCGAKQAKQPQNRPVCRSCGAPLKAGARFCPACGAKVEACAGGAAGSAACPACSAAGGRAGIPAAESHKERPANRKHRQEAARGAPDRRRGGCSRADRRIDADTQPAACRCGRPCAGAGRRARGKRGGIGYHRPGGYREFGRGSAGRRSGLAAGRSQKSRQKIRCSSAGRSRSPSC